MATGEYVCHLDGDDYWLPGKIRTLINVMEKNKNVTATWHKVKLLLNDGSIRENGINYSMFPSGIVTLSHALQIGSIGPHSSIMYRRVARKTHFPYFLTLDVFYTWELLESGNGLIIDGSFGIYRVNSTNSIRKGKTEEFKILYCTYARHFLSKNKSNKKSIFIFSTKNLLIEIKNMRMRSIKCFLVLSIKSFSFINPLLISESIKQDRVLSLIRL
jgi:glycosyltransferase involved in cell wall biosynthesis